MMRQSPQRTSSYLSYALLSFLRASGSAVRAAALASFVRVNGKAALAFIAFAIPCIALSGPIKKSTDTLTILPIGSDVDVSETGNSESFVERTFGGGTWKS